MNKGLKLGLVLVLLCFTVGVFVNGEEGSTTTTTTTTTKGEFEHLAGEKYTFQAEVNRLMNIIINSLYSNKDIFLRELISNGSDALDKIRFLSLTTPALLDSKPELEIRIWYDKEANELYIQDSGIGMTKSDLINNLGNIAKSGTKDFVEKVSGGSASGDLSMIGQFGVGFYSAYLVADVVTVVTKHNDDKQYIWQSTSESTFTIAEDTEGPSIGRGTKIILHLKEDANEYLNQQRLKELVAKYSEFINFPIYLEVEKSVEVEEELTPEELEKAKAEKAKKEESDNDDDDDDEDDDDDDEDEEEIQKTRKVNKTVKEYEKINNNKPIWLRKPKDIEESEYASFYHVLAKQDTEDPLTHIHFNAEGDVDFKSILFVPSKAPPSLYDNLGAKLDNIKLYVRRVFITDDFDDLLPRYLNFIRGVVDSDDLEINVSRENLQESKSIVVIRRKLVRKAIEMLQVLAKDAQKATEALAAIAEKKEKIAKGELSEEEIKAEEAKKKAEEEAANDDDDDEDDEDDEDEDEDGDDDDDEEDEEELKAAQNKWQTFYSTFVTSLKLGVIEDSANRNRLVKLLQFYTSKSGDKQITLEEYLKNMKEDQKSIFYLSGASREEVEKSPFMEGFREHDLEVLYLVDPVDEYLTQHLTDYEGKKFVSGSKEGLKYGDETELSKEKEEFLSEKYKPAIDYLKNILDKKITKVAISNRIKDSPAVLVTSQWGYTANMERIMKAQALADPTKSKGMSAQKTLEINPAHPLIKELNRRLIEKSEGDETTKDMTLLIYDATLLTSGFSLDDQKEFAGRITRMMNMGFGLPADAKLVEDEFVPKPKEQQEEKKSDEVDEEFVEAASAHDEL